jgi:glycopeptide antibiotics resistance protein
MSFLSSVLSTVHTYTYVHTLYTVCVLLFTMQYSVRFYECLQAIIGNNSVRCSTSSLRFLILILEEKCSNSLPMDYLP